MISGEYVFSDIHLYSQEAVDAFGKSGIKYVHGELKVENIPGNLESPITDLLALENLIYVKKLRVYDFYSTDDTDLKFTEINFSSLKKVIRIDIQLHYEVSLGFEGLESLKILSIIDAGRIKSIGFTNLVELDELRINPLRAFQQIDLSNVFSGITSLNVLSIESDEEHIDLKGMLSNLVSVDWLLISNHGYLSPFYTQQEPQIPDISNFSFNGLDNLSSIDYLQLSHTTATSMGQFGFLNKLNEGSILSYFFLYGNPYLTDYCLISDYIDSETKYIINDTSYFFYLHYSDLFKSQMYTPTLEQILDPNTCKK